MSKEKANLDKLARYKFVIENIRDVVWEMDTNLIFTFVSPASKGLAGYEPEEMTGHCMLDFLVPESKHYVLEQWKKAMQDKKDIAAGSFIYDVEMICKNGNIIWCEVSVKRLFRENCFVGYIGTTRDISEKKMFENKYKEYLKELEIKNKQLEVLATMDMLTGAYNRRRFDYLVGMEIEKREKYGSPFSIIMFDIDSFKKINDDSGHKKGDMVLKDITVLIKNRLRTTDKLFRWGGDEFVILLSGLTLNDAVRVADKVREAIESFDFDTGATKVTISLGVGTYLLNETPDQFINRVDNALLRAKIYGKNNVAQG